MQTIYRVCSQYYDDSQHFKSFFKKEDAEIFLKELHERIEQYRVNSEENQKILHKAQKEFSEKCPFKDYWASDEYSNLLESNKLNIVEFYITELEESTIDIFEEIVY